MTAVCHRLPMDTDPPGEAGTVLASRQGRIMARSFLWLPLPGATAATYLLYRIIQFSMSRERTKEKVPSPCSR